MKLRRLNMDASWWFGHHNNGLLVDPWLHGPEADYATWFNTQWHRTPPLDYEALPPWTAVVITQKYADHFHAETLLRLRPTHLYVSFRVAAKVRRLLPNATVDVFSDESAQYTHGSFTLTYLPTRRRLEPFYDALYLDDGQHGVCFAPHGLDVDLDHKEAIADRPACSLLIAPYNHYRLPALLGGTVTPGLDGLKTLMKAMSPDRVCRTHDELKAHRGLIGRLARIDHVLPERIRSTPWLAPLDMQLNGYTEAQL